MTTLNPTLASDPLVKIATNEFELEAIDRLHHDIYVEEMHLDLSEKDHAFELHEQSRFLLATVAGKPAGVLSVAFGSDRAITDEVSEAYHLAPFIDVVGMDAIALSTDFATPKQYRRTIVPFTLLIAALELSLMEGVELFYCGCQPHLLNLYEALGFRTYCPTFTLPAWGVLVPLVVVIDDIDYNTAVESPLLKHGLGGRQPTQHTERILELLPETPPVRSGEKAVEELLSLPEDDRPELLRGLTDDQLETILSRSHVIDLQRDDVLIRVNQTTQMVFLVLSGEMEVRDGSRVIASVGQGEVLGEVAFLLRRVQTADVCVTSEKATVLGLSESRLRRLIDSHSPGAAIVLHHMTEILARRLTH